MKTILKRTNSINTVRSANSRVMQLSGTRIQSNRVVGSVHMEYSKRGVVIERNIPISDVQEAFKIAVEEYGEKIQSDISEDN